MAAPNPPAAGGFLIAVGAIGGASIGFATGQPTLWFLAGTTTGIAAALLIWWRGAR